MKTKKSIKNSISSVISNIIIITIGFVAKKIFIDILGTEYLGINSLFSNIISLLGIVELGLGSAIIYNLYKPIVENDKETIKSLMSFYKKAYHIIAFVVLILGLIIMIFLKNIVNDVTINTNIYLIFFLFIIDVVFSYIISYKRSILFATQNNYIINYIHILCFSILNILQIILLIKTQNYYLYLIIKIVMRIIENIIITLIVNKNYPYLKEKNIDKLDKKIEKDIFSKVKALFLHQIAGYIVTSTDNIIISKYIGIITVGLYSNYYMIIKNI